MALLDKPAETKRVKISKAQKMTLLEVLGASLVVGTCGVLVSSLLQFIEFNATVIGKKNDAITEYDQSLRNVGICIDRDKDGRLSDADLKDCKPNEITLEQVPNTLRYNIYETMAKNPQLESVARKRDEDGICYDSKGELIDFITQASAASSDDVRERLLEAAKMCSSLRVISDALPNQQNTEAMMASLNQLFLVSGVDPERLTPKDGVVAEEEETGLGVLPIGFGVEGTGRQVLTLFTNIEKSIRTYDMTSANLEWSAAGIEATVEGQAYYMNMVFEPETSKTIRPGATANAKPKSTGSSK